MTDPPKESFLARLVGRAGQKAASLVVDRKEEVVRRAETYTIGSFPETVDKIRLLLQWLEDSALGRYREAPMGTLASTAFALAYLVAPRGSVPEELPGVGPMDDATVIGLVVEGVKGDLIRYALWKGDNPGRYFPDVQAKEDER